MRQHISFRRQDPPKPNPARRAFDPIRGSEPATVEISLILAFVASQIALIELILLIRWAIKAFETILPSSADHASVVMMRSLGTQGVYRVFRADKASELDSVPFDMI